MKVVVVGGHSRDIGKTAVVTGIIRGLKSLPWTAVKISLHAHGLETVGGKPLDAAPTERTFALSEESEPYGGGDSGRFLVAGARRAIWLRARPGRLGDALPALKQALGDDPFVIIESNRILNLVRPAACLAVLDGTQRDFKPSARRFLGRADALVLVGPSPDRRIWHGIDAASLRTKPVLALSTRRPFNSELCRFIRRRLRLAAENPFAGGTGDSTQIKEQPWLH